VAGSWYAGTSDALRKQIEGCFTHEFGPGETPEVVKKASLKVLSYDEETGAISALGKLDKGVHESKHTHPSDCGFMILEGKLVDENGNEIKKGMYVRVPAGVEEGPYDAPEGCVLFVHSNGPLW